LRILNTVNWAGLSQFQPGEQAVVVAFLAKLIVIHAAVILPHVLFQRAQQIVRRVVEQFGLGLCLSLGGRFQVFNLPLKRFLFR